MQICIQMTWLIKRLLFYFSHQIIWGIGTMRTLKRFGSSMNSNVTLQMAGNFCCEFTMWTLQMNGITSMLWFDMSLMTKRNRLFTIDIPEQIYISMLIKPVQKCISFSFIVTISNGAAKFLFIRMNILMNTKLSCTPSTKQTILFRTIEYFNSYHLTMTVHVLIEQSPGMKESLNKNWGCAKDSI